MITNTYINVATKDVVKAREFFTKIGFEINESYSDEQGFCVVVNEKTFMMVLKNERFESFTHRHIPNSFKSNEMIISFEAENQSHVDAMIDHVIASGGKELGQPSDTESMYFRSFSDLDGHHFEAFSFKK